MSGWLSLLASRVGFETEGGQAAGDSGGQGQVSSSSSEYSSVAGVGSGVRAKGERE